VSLCESDESLLKKKERKKKEKEKIELQSHHKIKNISARKKLKTTNKQNVTCIT